MEEPAGQWFIPIDTCTIPDQQEFSMVVICAAETSAWLREVTPLP